MNGGRIVVMLAVSTLAIGGAARADGPDDVRQAIVVFDDKQILRTTLSYHDIVDAATQKKLTGGLPTTIVMTAGLVRDTGGPPLVPTYKSCKVTYDIWDEVYRLEISQPGRANEVTATVTLEGVLRRCAEAERLSVASRALLPASGNYHFEVLVEINPVSQEMLERIKRWVGRPTGASTAAPGDALFGSFVGLFVARIGSADRAISFRTQSFSF